MQHTLKSEILQIAKKANCEISIFFNRMDEPKYNFEIDSHTLYPIASTFKLNLLIATVELFNLSIAKESDLLTLQDYHKVPGSLLSNSEPGTKFTLKELLELMMSRSDNTATDILCEFLSLRNVLKAMPSWGVLSTKFIAPTKLMIHLLTNLWPCLSGKTFSEQIQFWESCSPDKKMEIIEESYSCLQNLPASQIQSAADSYYDSLPISEGKKLLQSLGWAGNTNEYGNLVLRILNKTLINEWVSDTVRSYMQLGGKGLIKASLEKFSSIKIRESGRKGGSDEGVRCDTGYIICEDGKTAVISIFVKETSDVDDTNEKLEDLISSICELTFKHSLL